MDELDLMLLELKDTSELMIDLAYSSLLYNNRDIAEEVFQMEEALDEWPWRSRRRPSRGRSRTPTRTRPMPSSGWHSRWRRYPTPPGRSPMWSCRMWSRIR